MYTDFEAYAKNLANGTIPLGTDVMFDSPLNVEYVDGLASHTYRASVHNGNIAKLLRAEYSPSELKHLAAATEDLRRINVVKQPWGTYINAASFESQEEASATNYDAIWVRDSIWGYYALLSDTSRHGDAKAVLLTQLDYLASQVNRINAAIAQPELLDLPDPLGSMNAIHIRFNGASSTYDDVIENGLPQSWTHKQNDALGLALEAAISAFAEGLLSLDELTEPLHTTAANDTATFVVDSAMADSAMADSAKINATQADSALADSRLAALIRLVAYLNAVHFYEMEDSGAWEEQARRNTSSIGIVVSALERLESMLTEQHTEHWQITGDQREAFVQAYHRTMKSLRVIPLANEQAIAKLIASGTAVMHRQISLGGESPDYDLGDSRRREADAALLSLIYPASPHGLGVDEQLHILTIVGSLIGDYGIKRYDHDTYQSANFWWHDIKPDADPESHLKREAGFIEGTEAEWFFDSWYAKCCLLVAQQIESGQELSAADSAAESRYLQNPQSLVVALRATAVRHLNRALGQVTGEGMISADGKVVAPNLLPESYNHIVSKQRDGSTTMWSVPSPIAPLNWAKASLTLCLAEFLK
ncbi:hypothetical protein [Bifidobacterium sp.]|jgi:hypothetical protein|uniref:hypothetical protein n=1 Tax=Bifidobacterium sp. TaxID=41200 RepID=UPI0025BE03B7|nr:hypothetical protein [Bifidobacterium sp.]MCI1635257.1 hypothetical protein [Bifidobacterium sp.]